MWKIHLELIWYYDYGRVRDPHLVGVEQDGLKLENSKAGLLFQPHISENETQLEKVPDYKKNIHDFRTTTLNNPAGQGRSDTKKNSCDFHVINT